MATDVNPVESILAIAVEIASDAERRAYVEQACAGDEELKRRVQQMIEDHFRAGSFLESGAGDLSRTTDQEIAERPGTMIGPYKLLQQIGEGGFGVVFMAEQTEPMRRKVALKVLKAGMDTRQVVHRFEAERQALAIMDHPNIARVFDGGATPPSPPSQGGAWGGGRPYFVMELVKGVPITEFCDQHHLTPRQRLELFIPVCQAVQHAHQKGIIHRDLKPSNILVVMHDTTPVPKVIDFGIAKALGQELTDKTLFTGFAQMVGTPLYMSPEQAGHSGLDIDTRSDIYSLGVLLYELLTGTTPFDKDRFKQAAYDEIRRIIREEDPPKPSTRLSNLSSPLAPREDSADTIATHSSLASVAAQRHTEPAKLTKLVRGELDWIVMKALEKDRNRRYETANGFAMDVQRYLADEPVQACPPSAGYRLKKFVRRNKGGLAVAALVLFFLVLLGSGAGWAWRDRAARQAEQASNLERAVERAELLQRQGKRGETLAALERAQLLAREAEPIPPLAERIELLQQRLDAEGRDDVFVAQFEAIRREVQTEVDVGKSHFRGYKGYPKLREALEQYGIAMGVTPPATAVSLIHKRPSVIQAVLIAALDECFAWVSAEDSASREWLIDVLRRADSDPWRNKVRRAWKQPATLETLAKDIDVRQQAPSFLLLLANRLPIASPGRLDLEHRVQFAYPGDFWANHALAFDLRRAGKDAEAIRYYTAALSLRPDNPGVLLNRANALNRAGEVEAAIADLQRAVAVAPRYAVAYNQVAWLLATNPQAKFRNPSRAVDLAQGAVELKPEESGYWRTLGVAYYRATRWEEALSALEKSCRLEKATNGKGNAWQWLWLAMVHWQMGHKDEARSWYDKAVQLETVWPEELARIEVEAAELLAVRPGTRRPLLDHVRTLVEAGQSDQAAAQLAARLEELPRETGPGWDAPRRRLCRELAEWDEVFRRLVQLRPEDADLWIGRGRHFALRSDWKQAADAYARVIHSEPLTDEGFEYACLLLLREDRSGYRLWAQRVAERAARSKDSFELFVAVRICALVPEPVIPAPRLVQWAKQMAGGEPPAWYLHAFGAAYYRAGDFEQALRSLQESNAKPWGELDKAQNWLMLAMAQHRLGRADEARKSLDEARRRIAQATPADPLALASAPVPDWLGVQVLRMEAEALLAKEPGDGEPRLKEGAKAASPR